MVVSVLHPLVAMEAACMMESDLNVSAWMSEFELCFASTRSVRARLLLAKLYTAHCMYRIAACSCPSNT